MGSRIANNPINIPSGIEVNINNNVITIKSSKDSLTHKIHNSVKIEKIDNILKVSANNNSASANALSGTTRAIIYNMVVGLSKGFERKLILIGVGYRAEVKDNGGRLILTLGFSHPVNYELPEGVMAETPSQTEVVLKGSDKQSVGQVAAKIRAFRPPEPYKGKGIRYSDEHVIRKEGKKK